MARRIVLVSLVLVLIMGLMATPALAAASDEIYVDQVNPAELEVEIVEPEDGAEFTVCQNFTVTAVVSNIAPEPEADAVDVTATITYGDNMQLVSPTAEQFLGTISSDEPVMVSWEMHCVASSLADYITVTAEGQDANTGDPISASETIYVDQVNPAELDVEITEPEDGAEFTVCQSFTVTAVVSNIAVLPAADAVDVTATITFGDNMGLVEPLATQGPVTIPSGSPWTVRWLMHCRAASLADFITVTAEGQDANTGDPVSASDTIYVDQLNPAELGVEITEPEDRAEFSVCQGFAVEAKVSNIAPDPAADAVEVTATITLGPNVELHSPGATQFLGTVSSGSPVTVTWLVHCRAASLADYITVTAEGRDANTGFPLSAWDIISVDQVKAAELEVEIDIKPGNYPNSINPDSKGMIPVAVITTDEFDASTVDPATLGFGPAGATPVHYALEDVDDDGDIDMILHFKTQDTGIQHGDTEATLTGQTYDGREITGTDSVRTVPAKGKGK